jgi:Zn-finger protein
MWRHTSECLAIHEHNNKHMVLTELLSQITRADKTGYQRKLYIKRP